MDNDFDFIFGIQINDGLCKTKTLDANSDISIYDFICYAVLINSNNGNGTYNIKIRSKDSVSSQKLHGWIFDSADFSYNWGSAGSSFKLIDKDHVVTERILAASQKGSQSSEGFDEIWLIKQIFPKALEIIEKFPSAEVYNLYTELNRITSYSMPSFYKDKDHKQIVERFIERTIPASSEYLKYYNRIIYILSSMNNERSKELLKEVQENAYQFFKETFDVE